MALLAERGLGQVRGQCFDNGQELVFVKFAYSVLPKEAKDSLKEMGVPSWSFGPPKAEARDCLQPRHGVVFLSRAVSRFEAKLCLPASGSFAARRRLGIQVCMGGGEDFCDMARPLRRCIVQQQKPAVRGQIPCEGFLGASGAAAVWQSQLPPGLHPHWGSRRNRCGRCDNFLGSAKQTAGRRDACRGGREAASGRDGRKPHSFRRPAARKMVVQGWHCQGWGVGIESVAEVHAAVLRSVGGASCTSFLAPRAPQAEETSSRQAVYMP